MDTDKTFNRPARTLNRRADCLWKFILDAKFLVESNNTSVQSPGGGSAGTVAIGYVNL